MGNLADLTELRHNLQLIRKQIFDYRFAKDHQPTKKDFDELILIKVELSDTSAMVVKIVEYWGLNK